jgi:hypothetical protein
MRMRPDAAGPSRALIAVLAIEIAVAAVAAATIVDLRAHSRGEQARGVNKWGFRGTARLRPLGRRVAIVGGSAAYGYGVDAEQSFGGYLKYFLALYAAKQRARPTVDAVNLAAVGDGAASYAATLREYAYLRPDAVCIYDGYAGLGFTGAGGARGRSGVFRAVGYFPIVGPFGGDAALAAPVLARVDPFLDDGATGDVSCSGGSRAYCAAMIDTAASAADRGLLVAIVTPPYVSARHAAQQASLAAAIRARFGVSGRVRYFDMGRTVDLASRAMSFDGVHLTARGNQTVADKLSTPLLAALEGR